MDEIINLIDMKFHPLMDINREEADENMILKRESIKILTYNIFLRPPLIKNNENDWKNERLRDFIQLLNNFDIICLQEMFDTLTIRRDEIIKYSKQSGIFFYVDCPSPSFFSKNLVDAGLLVMSRFPILESEFRPFTYSILGCTWCEKGVLYTKIKVKDETLAIFNIHLQSSYEDISEEDWELCSKTRICQIDETCDFISAKIRKKEICGDDVILLLGDFNIDAHKNESKKLLQGDKYKYMEFDEYNSLLTKLNEKFNAVDIVKRKFDKHPYTFGVTGDEENPQYDMVLTDKDDVKNKQTLDYIFEIFTNESERTSKKLQVLHESPKIEQFLVSSKNYQQLSDHFGISVEINYKTKCLPVLNY